MNTSGRIISVLIAGMPPWPLLGQNLVSNPGFEVVSSCPSGWSQIDSATGWSSYRDSPDLFHTCASDPDFGVPSNTFGFQGAASGDGYGGLYCYYESTIGPNMREYLGSQLITPLIPGQQVYVSFKASLARNVPSGYPRPRYATDRIGILFLTQPLNQGQYDTTVFDHAHIYTPWVILDSIGWSTISGVFTPDSAYTHLAVGNFFDDDSLNVMVSDSGGFITVDGSYYYVDDICVSLSPQDCEITTASLVPDAGAIEAVVVDGALIISGLEGRAPLEVTMADPAGRHWLSPVKIIEAGRIAVPLGQLSTGIYLLRLNGENVQHRTKVFVP